MRININTNKATRQVLFKIKNLSSSTRQGIREGFERMGSGLVRTFENQTLNEPKFGREYHESTVNGVKRLSRPTKNRKANYRASSPDQSPALLSGNYFESIYAKPQGSLGLVFGNDAKYAKFLELGTEKMEPRPGLLNAIKASLKNSRNYLEDSLDKNIIK